MIPATLVRSVSKRAPEPINSDNSHPIDTIPEEREAEYALEMLMLDGYRSNRFVSCCPIILTRSAELGRSGG